MMVETFKGNWQLHLEQVLGVTHSTLLGKCTPSIFKNEGEVEKVMFLAFVDLNESEMDAVNAHFNL